MESNVEITAGIVVSVSRHKWLTLLGGKSAAVKIRYMVEGRDYFRWGFKTGPRVPRVGSLIRVVYDPKNPRRAAVAE